MNHFGKISFTINRLAEVVQHEGGPAMIVILRNDKSLFKYRTLGHFIINNEVKNSHFNLIDPRFNKLQINQCGICTYDGDSTNQLNNLQELQHLLNCFIFISLFLQSKYWFGTLCYILFILRTYPE